MGRAPSLITAVLVALAGTASAARVSLVVTDADAARAARSKTAEGVKVLAFDRERFADPIEKGRFLAALHASDVIISASRGRACGWLGREVEDVPIHCFLPYDARQVLEFARDSGWRRVAALYMPGYEKIFAHLRALARARGVDLVGARVERSRDLTAAVPRALKNAQALWILGDPLLTESAPFDFIVETTLAARIPLIAPGAEFVARGAFLGAENDPAALLRASVETANAAAGGAPPPDVVGDVPGGRLVVNKVLARRWGLKTAEAPR